jgi:DNA-binding Xre family transcriptional regulator
MVDWQIRTEEKHKFYGLMKQAELKLKEQETILVDIKSQISITEKQFSIIQPSNPKIEFDTVKEVCEYLNISRFTLYSIINEKCNFIHPGTKHLKGIKIISATIDIKTDKILHQQVIINRCIDEYNDYKKKYESYK